MARLQPSVATNTDSRLLPRRMTAQSTCICSPALVSNRITGTDRGRRPGDLFLQCRPAGVQSFNLPAARIWRIGALSRRAADVNDPYKNVYNGTLVIVREFRTPGLKLSLTDHRGINMDAIRNPLIEGFGDCLHYADFDKRRHEKTTDGRRKLWYPFTLDYACTVHKAQGSEWDKALVVLRGDPQGTGLYSAFVQCDESRALCLHA